MKKRLLAIIMTMAMIMQMMAVLPAHAMENSSQYSLTELGSIELLPETKDNYFQSVAAVQIGTKTFAYVGKENTNDAGGIYVYDVTNPQDIRFVTSYCDELIPGVWMNGTPLNDKLHILKNGTEQYLIFCRTAWSGHGTEGVSAVQLNADGTFDLDTYSNLENTNYWYTKIKVVDDYVIYSNEKNINVYQLQNGVFEKKGEYTTAYNITAFAAQIVAGQLYVLTAETNTVEGVETYYVRLLKSGISDAIQFIETDEEEAGVRSGLFRNVNFINNRSAAIAYDTQNGNSLIAVNVSESDDTLSVTYPESERCFVVAGLNSGYYATGHIDSITIYQDGVQSQISKLTLGGQWIGMTELDGKLYAINTDGYFGIFSYKTEVRITSSEGNCVEPNYSLSADVLGLKAEDELILNIDGTETDVTADVENEKLEKIIPVTNGTHTITLAVKRQDGICTQDEIIINVDIKPQLEITNVSVSGNKVLFEIENLYTNPLKQGIVIACVYDDMGMVDKGKMELVSFEGSNPSAEITVQNDINSNGIAIFAIESLANPCLVSNVETVSFASDAFEAVVDKDKISRLNDKPNAIQEIDPATKKFTTNIVGKDANTQKVVMLVFENAAKTWDDVCFAFTGDADAEGYVGVAYTINNDPSEGDIYYTTVAMGQNLDWNKNDSITKSYYGITTINSVLEAIKLADENTIYGVLTDSLNAAVLNLDFAGDYASLGEQYQKNVLKSIAGREFSAVGDVVNAFNSAVSEQKIQKMEDELDKALVERINTATEETIEAVVMEGAERLGINTTGLYALLASETKTALYNEYLVGKNFADKAAVSNAFAEGVCMKTVSASTYINIIENKIIENYYSELGISAEYANKYSAANNKETIIKKFLNTNISSADKIGNAFETAYKNAQNTSNIDSNNGGTRPSYGGGGNGIITIPGTVETIDPGIIDPDQKPADPDDEIIFNDVNMDQWYSNAVYALARLGHVSGVSENMFAPDAQIKREEFVKMVVSAFGFLDNTAETQFTDTNDLKWHYRYIASAQRAGIISGVDNHTFGVGETLTREDMAVILDRVITKKGINLSANQDIIFEDAQSISAYARESVKKMADAQIINGYPDNEFKPKATATRAQATQLIWNIMNY